MIKIKTDRNPKLLQNFSNEAYPDITILTASSKYNLTLAYLSIDSQLFNSIPPNVREVDLSYLPEKPLVQVLRALYGDQLIACSIPELQAIFKVIKELRIDEYVEAIIQEIKSNKDLMQNLQILEFCVKNDLMVNQISRVHIENNLRALQNNKNFLQLNKISLDTLIPLLLEYNRVTEQSGASVINNILSNYFDRNAIRPVQFFEQQEDDTLLNIWQRFHHILHIQRKPTLYKTSTILEEDGKLNETKTVKSKQEMQKIKEKDQKIAELNKQIQEQDKLIDRLKTQLQMLKAETGQSFSTKRMPSNPILSLDDEEDDISILETVKNPKKDLFLRNIKSDFMNNIIDTVNPTKLQTKTPNRHYTQYKLNKADF